MSWFFSLNFEAGTLNNHREGSMRVLITGAGLIGCHTARELVERGDDVTFLDLAPRPDYIRHVVGRDLPMIRGDIRDLPCLVDAMQDVRPDCVIHLAALVGE